MAKHTGAQRAAIALAKKVGSKKRGSQRAGKAPSARKKSTFPGDVNRDGKINAADFRLARKMGRLA